MGSDAKAIFGLWTASGFNSRSRMGSDARLSPTVSVNSSFNSRSRMGSDTPPAAVVDDAPVSIHAPAWGATGEDEDEDAAGSVSIHAPAWGATYTAP